METIGCNAKIESPRGYACVARTGGSSQDTQVRLQRECSSEDNRLQRKKTFLRSYASVDGTGGRFHTGDVIKTVQSEVQ